MHVIIHIILTSHDAGFGFDIVSSRMFYQFFLKALLASFQAE